MERNILKAATFGVVHKTKAQTRICDLSINKRNHSRRIFIDFLTQNFGEDFDNGDIQKVIEFQAIFLSMCLSAQTLTNRFDEYT